MKRKLFLLLFFSLFYNFGYAQNYKLGLTLNLGVSKSFYHASSNFNSSFAKSGNLGLYLENNPSSNSGLVIELLFLQMDGLVTRNSLMESSGINFIEEERIHISYFGLPFYYRFQQGKFGIRLGVQPLFNIDSKFSRHRFNQSNNQTTILHTADNGFDFKSFDIGPKVGFNMDIFNRMKLRADIYLGILYQNTDSFVAKSNFNSIQFTVGLVSFFD